MGLRIVFMGSPEFAVPTLSSIVNSNHEVICVVTGEDKRRGRGNERTPTPVKAKALEYKIPVAEFDSMKDPALETLLRTLEPDCIVIVAFKILPKSLLSIPRLGAINIHASLLPKYRGAAPIHHALLNGESETGITLFSLNEGIDTGNIILQKVIPIGETDTTGDMYNKLMFLGAASIIEALSILESGNYTLKQQDESQATAAPKVYPETAHITFNKTAQQVHNHIRAMNPHPGSWILWDSKKMKLKDSRTDYRFKQQVEIGSWFLADNEFHVQCIDGSVRIGTVQLEGKREQPAIEFFNGYRGEGKIA